MGAVPAAVDVSLTCWALRSEFGATQNTSHPVFPEQNCCRELAELCYPVSCFVFFSLRMRLHTCPGRGVLEVGVRALDLG